MEGGRREGEGAAAASDDDEEEAAAAVVVVETGGGAGADVFEETRTVSSAIFVRCLFTRVMTSEPSWTVAPNSISKPASFTSTRYWRRALRARIETGIDKEVPAGIAKLEEDHLYFSVPSSVTSTREAEDSLSPLLIASSFLSFRDNNLS